MAETSGGGRSDQSRVGCEQRLLFRLYARRQPNLSGQ